MTQPRNLTTADFVKTIIWTSLDLGKQPSEDQHLFNDLGADSLDHVELVMNLEEQFDITFAETDIDNMKTVADVIASVESHTKREAA